MSHPLDLLYKFSDQDRDIKYDCIEEIRHETQDVTLQLKSGFAFEDATLWLEKKK
ncbi:hypothetical protein MED92_11764 [Oceanospirillum sp. MED92]|uniref:Uncharacterized protein n=1 Tax=Neptuniibacter caesariensis TaxID=207954 RepID=A0A7U8GRF0_NEPCE|nr:hypothetical protein MED92_11764 [Oceanospirillum sp. MED92] [Neptuniibacter caesariensis]